MAVLEYTITFIVLCWRLGFSVLAEAQLTGALDLRILEPEIRVPMKPTNTTLTLKLANTSDSAVWVVGFFDQGKVDPAFKPNLTATVFDSNSTEVATISYSRGFTQEMAEEILKGNQEQMAKRKQGYQIEAVDSRTRHIQRMKKSLRLLEPHSELITKLTVRFRGQFDVKSGAYWVDVKYIVDEDVFHLIGRDERIWLGDVGSNRIKLVISDY